MKPLFTGIIIALVLSGCSLNRLSDSQLKSFTTKYEFPIADVRSGAQVVLIMPYRGMGYYRASKIKYTFSSNSGSKINIEHYRGDYVVVCLYPGKYRIEKQWYEYGKKADEIKHERPISLVAGDTKYYLSWDGLREIPEKEALWWLSDIKSSKHIKENTGRINCDSSY